MMAEEGLRIRGLSVDYRTPRGRVHALRKIDLDVPKGSTVGIVGESGCGKSSLISAIIRLTPDNAEITSGKIVLGDSDLTALSPDGMQQILGERLSVVFQDPMTSLNPIRSIGRQMIDIQYRSKLTKAQKQQVAVDMLKRVGVSDPEHRLRQFAYQFSGGMRQRISIAMALMACPDLLIADEPTTALDATLEVQIIHLLKDLQQEIGCSILLVSHHLGMVAELCDHVVVLYAGEVVESGTVRDVFQRPAHPYTRRLLACDPGLIEEVAARLPTIAGEIPSLLDLPTGCIFYERCRDRLAMCSTVRPELDAIGNQHRAACHLLAVAQVAE